MEIWRVFAAAESNLKSKLYYNLYLMQISHTYYFETLRSVLKYHPIEERGEIE